MTSDSFLMAFHRFVALREKPSVVYSDNGSNFTAAEKELREEVEAIYTEKVQPRLRAASTATRARVPSVSPTAAPSLKDAVAGPQKA